ncbi:MAG TPA: PadR family transcriptional regulator [Candidatus Saccharimonadia bacterium]|nr:PadR family transcriptional regulator [Candidatus Saccharimonadia bacterium]
MKPLDDYEQTLLSGWEDTYSKGQLTLWIMLSLKDSQKHMGQIKDFILEATHGLVTPDDKSVYRSLRRFRDAQLVDHRLEPNPGGPALKIYQLTPTGAAVLQAFLARNIEDILYQPRIRTLIKQDQSWNQPQKSAVSAAAGKSPKARGASSNSTKNLPPFPSSALPSNS